MLLLFILGYYSNVYCRMVDCIIIMYSIVYCTYSEQVQYIPTVSLVCTVRTCIACYPEFRQLQYQSSIVFLVRLEVSVFCPKHQRKEKKRDSTARSEREEAARHHNSREFCRLLTIFVLQALIPTKRKKTNSEGDKVHFSTRTTPLPIVSRIVVRIGFPHSIRLLFQCLVRIYSTR